MGVSFIANRQLEMCEKGHGESVKVMISLPRQLDIPFGCSPYKSSLEKANTNGVIDIRIRGALEVTLHHMGLRILFRFSFKLRTIAQNLGRNWRTVWRMKNRVIHESDTSGNSSVSKNGN